MDYLPLPMTSMAAASSSSSGAKVLDAYKEALATAASVSAYVMLARGMARELLPDELRVAVRWGASFVRSRLGGAGKKERHTLVIRRSVEKHPSPYDNGSGGQNNLFDAARTYLATKINPRTMPRLCLSHTRVIEPDGSSSWQTLLGMEDGGSTTDEFEGVEFHWTYMDAGGGEDGGNNRGHGGSESLELSFDAEHADTVLEKYVPFIMSTAEELRHHDRALKIFLNDGGMWQGINHHHPATFESLAMDPALKRAVLDDLDRFLKRKEYYQRIGKAWKRGYLLYGPPGTGKSSLVAAIANHLRFNLYDLDLSGLYDNSCLQRLLIDMSNKSILVIEDIDCCFDTMSREGRKASETAADALEDNSFEDKQYGGQDYHAGGGGGYHEERKITLSGLLNFIDGLWSTCGEERVIVFTTNYRERLDPALLRPGRMDMHVYMGYCCWEAFKTLAHNYHLLDDHPRFPEIQELLAAVEVTPAEVSEMLLRSEDADAALQVLVDFLQERTGATKESKHKRDAETAVL